MTIRHLRIFIEVAETGKMSTAANNLFISQPTVSQTIKELENYYNILLFERLCKKLYITKEGEKLLMYAKNLVKQFDDLEDRMFEISNYDKLNIGGTVTIGNCLMSHVINSIQEKNPRIKTYSYINNTKIIEEKLLNSDLDIAIVEGSIKNPSLVSIPAIDDYLVLACGQNHPLAGKAEIGVEELKNLNFVMREKGSGTRELFENYMIDMDIPINTVWESNCPGAIKSAIMNNNCLAVLSIRLIEEEVRNGSIHVIHNSSKSWNRSFDIVYHKNKYIDSNFNEVIDIIKNYKDTNLLKEIPISLLV